MNWKSATGIALGGLVVGAALTFAGMRGCEARQDSRLQQEIAEARAAATASAEAAQQLDARLRTARRAVSAAETARASAERQIAALRALQAGSEETIETLRRRVRTAQKQPDERDDLILAQEGELARLRKLDLFNRDALQAALEERDGERLRADTAVEQSGLYRRAYEQTDSALRKAQKRLGTQRRRVALAAVGGVLGGSVLVLGSVYAAGKLPQ